MHAYMHTCITYITYLCLYLHALFVHDNRSCNKMYNLFFWWVGKAVRWQAYPFSWPQLRAKCEGRQARLNRNCGSTACKCTTGDKQGSTATADQLRRKTQPQLRTSVDARKANRRNCGELSAAAHYFSLPASLASCHVACLGTSAYIGGECCQREVGAIMLFSSAPPCRCAQSFSMTDKPIL